MKKVMKQVTDWHDDAKFDELFLEGAEKFFDALRAKALSEYQGEQYFVGVYLDGDTYDRLVKNSGKLREWQKNSIFKSYQLFFGKQNYEDAPFTYGHNMIISDCWIKRAHVNEYAVLEIAEL